MKKENIVGISEICDFQAHLILDNKEIVLYEFDVSIDGLYFNSIPSLMVYLEVPIIKMNLIESQFSDLID